MILINDINNNNNINANKIPYVISEIFQCETLSMLNTIIENETLLQLLFSFLDQPRYIEPENAAYWKKIMIILLRHKYDDIVHYVQGKSIIAKLITHNMIKIT